jgi:hypothetical protein
MSGSCRLLLSRVTFSANTSLNPDNEGREASISGHLAAAGGFEP